MAKRKRLTPIEPGTPPVLETKSAFSDDSSSRAPIAQVAGDAAASAALAELTNEMTQARAGGRMVLELPLDKIDADYLVRDRIMSDPDEMQSLIESIRQRGQQTPIEVVDLRDGRYGLISGWRRYGALRQLAEGGIIRPVLALMRCPNDVADAYLAMVEENEIRVGLSYYERAAVAAAAVDRGVFKSEKEALLHIYRSASRAKRSKIRSFLSIVHSLDGALVFPTAIGERMGLSLAKMLETNPEAGKTLRNTLRRNPAKSAEDEAKQINAALDAAKKAALTQPKTPKSAPPSPPRLPEGMHLRTHATGAVTLSGPKVTPALREKLRAWLARQK